MERETERTGLAVPGGNEEGPAGARGETGKGRRSGRRGGKLLLGIGASLTLCGLLILAGVFVYIHYTDRRAAAAQKELFRIWEQRPPAPEREPVAVGDGIARLLVSRLGLDAIVVELEGLEDTENLKRGPGHIPGTAYPGQVGNCVISGHRTTYGAPFRHIEQLRPGDEIVLETAEARYTYLVYEQRVVLPTDLTVLEQGEEREVTLTACHPWYSASRRVVVKGRLERTERHGGPDRDADGN
ncbi:sortase [Candidatus Solincola tengchongensis]|uniref:sortase n=1 Tax=Candidatus Solincola tengchongensis TaxID=2900693 RepID=UPI00257DC49D|nr:sortase [Candidatus Solincola tengchongensis]